MRMGFVLRIVAFAGWSSTVFRTRAAEAFDDDFLADPGDHDVTIPGVGIALDG